eukprot:scaffold26830_cov122-Isochrysis_galbana.AAC.1
MINTVLRLACLTALAVAVPVPLAALIPGAEQRPSAQDVNTAVSYAQSNLYSNVDSSKQSVQNALNPAQVDPSAVADAILALPATAIVALPEVGKEQVAALGAAVAGLHAQLMKLDGGGYIELDEQRWAQGLRDFNAMLMECLKVKAEAVSAVADEVKGGGA